MRYSVNSFAARLYEETQLGIVVNGNNINGMTIGGSGSTTGSGKPGLNSSFSTGINFSSGKEKKSPWIINGDLSYGENESLVNRNSMRQYYLLDSTSYQSDTVTQILRTQEIRFSGKIETRSIEGWTFSFTPSASYNLTSRNNSGFSLLQAGNANRDSVNTNNYTFNSMTPGFDIRGIFTASHRFKKKGRRLSFSIDSRFGTSEGAGETNARYYYYKRKNNPEVIRDQQWETNTTNFNNRLYLSYIEPIADKHSLQFVYWVRADNRENIRNNYKPDPETGDYSILDIPYSKSIENLTVTQQLGVSYRGKIGRAHV